MRLVVALYALQQPRKAQPENGIPIRHAVIVIRPHRHRARAVQIRHFPGGIRQHFLKQLPVPRVAREFQRQPSPAINAHIPIVRADGYARVVQHGGKRPRLHHGVRLPRTAFAGLADFRLDARVVQARIRVALPTVVGKPLEAVIRPVQPVVFVENGLPIGKKGFRHALRLLFTLPRGR